MKRILTLRGRSRPQRTESQRPLIQNNNNDIQDGYNHAGYSNLLAQNAFNTHEKRSMKSLEKIPPQDIAELLGVAPDATTSNDDLIQNYVFKHFPKPPADPNKNLQRHLSDLQVTVHKELVRLRPLLEPMGLMGCLIDCYQRQIYDHLNDLLQNIHSPQSSFVLMKWVLHGKSSPEIEPQIMDLMTEVDLWPFTIGPEWEEKTKAKVFENMQVRICTKYTGQNLKQILENERSKEGCDNEEAYIQVYMDTIQCLNAAIGEAQKISSNLSDDVQEVCFKELLIFLKSYVAEQKEVLKVKMDKQETTHLFKTLKTCKELKDYAKDRGQGIEGALLQETLATLEEMEDFTMKLLMEKVTEIAESHLKHYFKTQDKLFSLVIVVEAYFPKLSWCQDVQRRVMDMAYELIVHIYLKHLIQHSLKKLKESWSFNVGETVTKDAEVLHAAISEVAPDVKQWNLVLLKINDLLKCKCTDSVKLTVADMQKECLTWSQDVELLPAMLRWKGLPGRQVREVLDAIPGYQPQPMPWYSCLICS
ncbi:hypothetical protein L3Q82_026244 [Scortum barcoo]|uniref:Uncharacterized protein n=1 Tax=Scortum barcoo TaxID=214431 RepID=A0ACB8WJS0_9TELE|nr:hypothetical protein L3Q82_026244 [Scortum barcoo]